MNDIFRQGSGTSRMPIVEDTQPTPVVLQDFDLDIDRGSFVAVLGHQRLRQIHPCQALQRHSAALRAARSTVCGHRHRQCRQASSPSAGSVGMVFQNPDNQIVANVVEEDVAFRTRESRRCQPQEIRRTRGRAPWRPVGHVRAYHAPTRPTLLSGRPEAARCHCGRARHASPSAIVLDEPTAMLDPQRPAERLIDDRRTAQPGAGHHGRSDHPPHGRSGHRRRRVVVAMDDGEVVAADGTPKDVFSTRDAPAARASDLTAPQAVELLLGALESRRLRRFRWTALDRGRVRAGAVTANFAMARARLRR